jgi:hypothetical protein
MGISHFKAHMDTLSSALAASRFVPGPLGEAASESRPNDPLRGSLLTVFDLPIVLPPTTPRCLWFDLFSSRAYHLLPWLAGVPATMASWASPLPSGLATTTGRIEFVNLRTDCSLPVALHLLLRERSYYQLMGSDQPMSGLPPNRSNTITGALGRSCRMRLVNVQNALKMGQTKLFCPGPQFGALLLSSE